MSIYADRSDLIGSENAFKVGPYIREVEESGMRVIKCNLGEPDFSVPVHVRDAIKSALDEDLTHYCDPQGILPLRQAIAKQVSDTRGIKVNPDQVVVFPGAKPAIGFSQQTYVNPGQEIIYPSPGFPIYESFATYIQAKPVPLHLQEEKNFSFGGEELAALITPRTRLIILNFPSNPTGGLASLAQLQEIADVIKRHAPPDVRIFSDEIYENIILDGGKHVSIASLPGMAERTIISSGVSKTYAWTGGRVGWLVAPNADEAQRFKNLNINYFSCIPAYNQMGAKAALESPKSVGAIHEMVSAFRERRELVVDGLNSIPGITCQRPQGAFYVFPNISGACKSLGVFDAYESLPSHVAERTTPATLFQMFLLFVHGVASMDRKSFGAIGSDGLHFLRLSIATGSEDLKEGLKRIDKARQDKAGFAKFINDGKRLY